MSSLFLTPSQNYVTPAPIRIGLVGSGFRARTMLRVMSALPEWFETVGVAARNAKDRSTLANMGYSAYASLEHLIKHGRPDFVVCTIPSDQAQPLIAELAALRVPVLMETPADRTLEGLNSLYQLTLSGACIQVAEQYHLEPLIAAQLAVAASEMLGVVSDAQVSVAHDYHGISVLRRALGVWCEEPIITARQDGRQIFPSPSRYRDPEDVALVPTTRTLAWFDFDADSGVEGSGKLGSYDFDDSQYRSWVRTPTLVLRGPLGELRDEAVRLVSFDDAADPNTTDPDGADLAAASADTVAAVTPITAHLERIAAGGAGSHEGLFLRGYQIFGETAYRNPFLPARLADDEIAIAEMLARMGAHVLAGAPGPYSVAEAAQDQYLALVMKEAVATGQSIRARTQIWAP